MVSGWHQVVNQRVARLRWKLWPAQGQHNLLYQGIEDMIRTYPEERLWVH